MFLIVAEPSITNALSNDTSLTTCNVLFNVVAPVAVTVFCNVVAPVTTNVLSNVAASFTYNLLFKLASFATSNTESRETSPTICASLLAVIFPVIPAVPANKKFAPKDTSPTTLSLLFNRATSVTVRVLSNVVSLPTYNLLFKLAS